MNATDNSPKGIANGRLSCLKYGSNHLLVLRMVLPRQARMMVAGNEKRGCICAGNRPKGITVERATLVKAIPRGPLSIEEVPAPPTNSLLDVFALQEKYRFTQDLRAEFEAASQYFSAGAKWEITNNRNWLPTCIPLHKIRIDNCHAGKAEIRNSIGPKWINLDSCDGEPGVGQETSYLPRSRADFNDRRNALSVEMKLTGKCLRVRCQSKEILPVYTTPITRRCICGTGRRGTPLGGEGLVLALMTGRSGHWSTPDDL
jgi:hypothetical protein